MGIVRTKHSMYATLPSQNYVPVMSVTLISQGFLFDIKA